MTNKKANVTDVTPKSEETQAPAVVADPSLRSIATESGFAVGFAPGESVKEDGSFEITTSLIYKDINIAINQLESVLAHARSVQLQQVYNAGVAQGQAAASQPAEAEQQAPAKATEAPKAKTPAKKSKKK